MQQPRALASLRSYMVLKGLAVIGGLLPLQLGMRCAHRGLWLSVGLTWVAFLMGLLICLQGGRPGRVGQDPCSLKVLLCTRELRLGIRTPQYP